MEREKINQIIKRLEFIHRHLELHFNKKNGVDSTISFFMGIHLAFSSLTDLHDLWLNTRKKVFQNRGHKFTARGVWKELVEKNFSEEQIIDELFQIEIENLNLLAKNLEE